MKKYTTNKPKKPKKEKDYTNVWVADYETESHVFYEKYGYTQTWLTYIENLINDESYLSITIDDQFTFLRKQLNKTKVNQFVYFHNLSFDGTFILYYLESKGFRYETIVNDMKRIYEIKVWPTKSNRYISFRCSYLIFLCSVANLPHSTKSTIDYLPIRLYKDLKDVPEQEIYYIKQDVITVKLNLLELHTKYDINLAGFFKTMGSIAYKDLKETIVNKLRENNRNWNWYFPKLSIEIDDYIREGYFGGITTLNPKFKGEVIEEEVGSWDRVSSYPSAQVNEFLPAGMPYRSSYKPKDGKLYMIRIRVGYASIKEGYHPFINPHKTMRYIADIYPKELEMVVLTLTCVDYDLFIKYYDAQFDVIDYMIFPKKIKGLFNDYILKWYKVKESTKAIKKKYKDRTDLTPEEKIEYHDAIFLNMWAKLKLNSQYGKFGTNPKVMSSIPVFEDGILTWEKQEEIKEVNKFYLPVATFLTSYARKALIDQIQPNAERFIYCDTDSVHLIGTEVPASLNNLIGNELNKWEYEGTSYKSKFIKAKQYLKLKEVQGSLEIKRTIASLNKSEHYRINFDNFASGIVIPAGKRISKNVKGGRIIVPLDFTFR